MPKNGKPRPRRRPKQVFLNAVVDSQQIQHLDRVARSERRSRSDIVRRALELGLAVWDAAAKIAAA